MASADDGWLSRQGRQGEEGVRREEKSWDVHERIAGALQEL